MEKILLISLLKAYLLMHCAVNSEPDMEACIDNYELSFYCVAIQFEKAKEACKKEGSYLVKIDNANMTETINDVLDRLNCSKTDFHAGATADSNRKWTWLDGSKVYLSEENGYQNWKQWQPNDYNEREDCLKIDKDTKQWYDSPCLGVDEHNNPVERRYYICQKNLTLSIEIKEPSSNSIKCSATFGTCVRQVEWRQNNEPVSSFQNHSVYQVLSSGSTVLYHENATIADEGTYSCTSGVRENKLNQVEAVATIKVNATPEIYKIDSSQCNNSLLIFWQPQPTALGFPHRIKVNNTFGDQVRSIVETPNKGVQQVTEISGLQPTTVYYIQISACTGENLCPGEHIFNTTATTGGVIIKNATMYQMNDYGTCTVSWEWPYNITAVFKININSSSDKKSGVNTSELNVFVNKTEFSYSFEPSPELIYEVQIQSTVNPDFCPDPVKAVGSCTGEIKQTTAQIREFYATTISATSIPSKITDIVIPVSAAGGGFVLLVIILVVIYCKRSKRNEMEVKENPIYGVTNTVADESDVHLHSTSKKQDGENIATKDNTNDGKPQNDLSAMVVNPLYGDVDLTTKFDGRVHMAESQGDFNDAPVYAAVDKVRKKQNLSSKASASDSLDASTHENPVYAVVDKNAKK